MLGRKTTNSLLHLTKPYSLGDYSKIYVDDAEGIYLANDHYSTGMVLYQHLSSYGYAIFDLKNKYKTLSFTAFVPTNRPDDEKTLYVYADDELVKQIKIKANDLPKRFTLDIDNCAKLEFKLADEWRWENKINFANITVAK